MNFDVLIAFLFSFFFVAILATFSSSLTDTTSSWYACASPKKYIPPGRVFSVVWSVLYIVFVYILTNVLVHDDGTQKIEAALLLIVNALCLLWVFLFFQMHLVGYSLGVLLCILILSLYIVWIFMQSSIHKKLGILMLPFIGWISFATFLTYETYKQDIANNCVI